jgi:hypothetical protein
MKMCFPVWNGWVRTWTCPDGAAEGGHAEVDCRGLEWIAASFEWSIFCVLLAIHIPHTESRLPVAGFLCCAARPSPNNCTRDCFMFLCNFFFRDDEKPSRNTFTACTTDNKTRDNVYNRTLQKTNQCFTSTATNSGRNTKAFTDINNNSLPRTRTPQHICGQQSTRQPHYSK